MCAPHPQQVLQEGRLALLSVHHPQPQLSSHAVRVDSIQVSQAALSVARPCPPTEGRRWLEKPWCVIPCSGVTIPV